MFLNCKKYESMFLDCWYVLCTLKKTKNKVYSIKQYFNDKIIFLTDVNSCKELSLIRVYLQALTFYNDYVLGNPEGT